MTDTPTLSARLRAEANSWLEWFGLRFLLREAAAALDSKDKTVEELVRERDLARAELYRLAPLDVALVDERDRLREAVHDALPFMAGECVDHPDAPNHQCAHTHRRTLAKLIGDQSPWVSLLTKETRAAAKEER